MNAVTSKDGTRIVFDRAGEGPPLILVDGALSTRSSGLNAPLAALLAPQLTVFTFDRRGRGDSGDTAPYEVEREIEDIEAILDVAGGRAFLYGISSGAVLALEAAKQHPSKITKLALYETPFVVDGSRAPVPPDYLARLHDLVRADRRGDALKLFLSKGVGVPAIVVSLMQFLPMWSGMKAIAHTIPYDATVLAGTQSGDPLPAQRWSSVTMPTLVVDGGKSPTWMRNSVKALAALLPNARQRTLEGQTHIVKPAALAPILSGFFAA